MFARAFRLAVRYTRPVVILRRRFDGTIECGCGAFVVINEEGWIATANHLFRSYDDSIRHADEIAEHYGRIAAIQQDPRISAEARRRKIFRLPADPRWITHHTFWWGGDGVRIRDVMRLPEADLAVGRLEPFVPGPAEVYASFKNPACLDVGTSLCKLGYPFQEIAATFRADENAFELPPAALSLTHFPIEGMYTRTLSAGRSGDGKYDIKFVETSSPGLTGQSGGPIFDAAGTVWAVQSRTDFRPFGCCGRTIGASGKRAAEKHFLHVGVGVHPEIIASFLSANGVRFSLSD
ncbi:MAG: S1 family peptidase [Deltaproteobacteria bacterium]